MTYTGDLTPTQAWELLQQNPHAVLVDVRTQAEWSFVGVPDTAEIGRPAVFAEWNTFPDGARNPQFLDQLAEAGITGEEPVLFLCRSGARSIAAAEAATAAGLGPAYNVLDGFEGATNTDGHRGDAGWRAEGLPWKQS
ncbi:rhodanese-like domain-containing protein [Ruania zhangjianzhongii]|uniref:rhodanese-like domain-containing protein n=1 Tax=Ruania zhangjianzhongii TaxID=2603206 RepID=UPI0011C86F8A|nr:rhodanese-like domain-containing protein [Ruania zhangjianzhongii]